MQEAQTIVDNKDKFYTKKDIFKVREQGGRGLPVDKVYDPDVFWNDLGEDYFKAFNSQAQLQANTSWLIDRMKGLNITTLLDAGCGFGRVLPFLLEAGVIKSANGVDISESILKSSEEYLNPVPTETIKLDDYRAKIRDSQIDDMLKIKLDELLIQQYSKRKQNPPDFRDKIILKKGDLRCLDMESDSFDCVLSSEVLQHLSPEDAKDALLHIVRVSSRAIILVERFFYLGEHSQPDLWSHDYYQMLKGLGLDVAQSSQISQGIHGIVVLKK